MQSSDDPRLPVIFGPAALAGPDDALLLDPGAASPAAAGLTVRLSPATLGFGHAAGCACCQPRDAAAQALGRLFVSRARGEVVAFRRLVVALADPDAVREALRSDRFSAARFRIAELSPPSR